MTEFREDWVTGVIELYVDEAFALWKAIQRGFLTSARPTGSLVRTYSLIWFLEDRIGVVLIPDRELSKVIVVVPDMDWLPVALQRFGEAGAFVERGMPEVGVVSALVPGHRAPRGIAQEAAALAPGSGERWRLGY